MGSQVITVNHVVNGESENSRHCRNACDGTTVNPCCEEETSGVASDNINLNVDNADKEMTFRDIINKENAYMDDDEDDSDWEPLPWKRTVEIPKWFCTNCTMSNLDYAVHCGICGEHRNSGILTKGFYASPLLEDGVVGVESELPERNTVTCPKSSSLSCSTAVGFDERMLLHSEVMMKSHPHPERPDRLRAIVASLASAGIFPGRCHAIPSREITPEELQKVHSLEHVDSVEITSQMFSSYFTPDTYANEHSARAARLAAGLCSDLASEIVAGRAKNGFALVRPPGHHAGIRHAMGFCLHNNAAVAALAAQAAGAKKVLIVDWDVHHGNGTQEIFDGNKSVLYVSLHRHEGGDFYPGTGAALEVGSMGAEGYCVNVPWSRAGVGDNDYIYAFEKVVLPIASAFSPDFTIISAGFDAARGDPLGCCDVTPAGYAEMTKMLTNVSGGKMLVILEGGYNLRSISSSATSVVKALLGEHSEEPTIVENRSPSRSGQQTVLEVLHIQKNFWPVLEPSYVELESQLSLFYAKRMKKLLCRKRRRILAPVLWKCGKKSILYHVLRRRCVWKSKR